MSDETPKKRGGARPGAGRKKQLPDALVEAKIDGRKPAGRSLAGKILERSHAEELWLSMIELECDRLRIDPKTGKRIPPKPKTKRDENAELQATVDDRANVGSSVDEGDYKGNFSTIPLTNILKYLEDRHYGRPVDTVNHLHDKPLEINARLTLGEGMKVAMMKAEERLRKPA